MHDDLVSGFMDLARENPRVTIRYCRVGSLEEITLGGHDSAWHGQFQEHARQAADAFNIPGGFRGWLRTVYLQHPAEGPARKGRALVGDGKSEEMVEEQMVEEEISNAARASAFVVRKLAIEAAKGGPGNVNRGLQNPASDVPEHAGVKGDAEGESIGEKDDEAMLSAPRLAARFGVNPEALRKKLERWRTQHDEGWSDVQNRATKSPKYLYKLGSVRAVIESMKTSAKRPPAK